MKQITRSRSLTEIATEELRGAIVDGTLQLGQLLSENALAGTLGISRTPVREALSQLRLEGLVRVTPRGSCVFSLSAVELKELCEFRFGLESLAIKAAVGRRRDQYAEAMAGLIESMKRHRGETQMKEYLNLDAQFHKLAFSYSGNHYLEEAYRMVEGKICAMRTHLAYLHDLTDRTLDDHQAIAEAVERADADGAIGILDRHINSVASYYSENAPDIAEEDAQKNPPLR
ncbi:GntR family transcriptional regulator [Marinobacter bohaiensis]|uniref:GntR family transcriptional regulator n=1 Tax=Marinobacter bohaiensis TaxID=2201898 RepID=UPI000DAD64FB|nr:GntR family transcriptional regulator [Marinobacter bohaiensis]